MAAVVETLATHLGTTGKVRVLLHSIAYGNLRPVVPVPRAERAPALARLAEALGIPAADVDRAADALAESGEPVFQSLRPVDYGEAVLDDEDMARTIYSMGTSLLTWVQRLHANGLFAADARVIGLTSEGNDDRVARLRRGGCRQVGARIGVAGDRGRVRPVRHPLEHRPARRDGHARAARHPRQRSHEGRRPAAATRSAA